MCQHGKRELIQWEKVADAIHCGAFSQFDRGGGRGDNHERALFFVFAFVFCSGGVEVRPERTINGGEGLR
jgi:hypothetical protein